MGLTVETSTGQIYRQRPNCGITNAAVLSGVICRFACMLLQSIFDNRNFCEKRYFHLSSHSHDCNSASWFPSWRSFGPFRRSIKNSVFYVFPIFSLLYFPFLFPYLFPIFSAFYFPISSVLYVPIISVCVPYFSVFPYISIFFLIFPNFMSLFVPYCVFYFSFFSLEFSQFFTTVFPLFYFLNFPYFSIFLPISLFFAVFPASYIVPHKAVAEVSG